MSTEGTNDVQGVTEQTATADAAQTPTVAEPAKTIGPKTQAAIALLQPVDDVAVISRYPLYVRGGRFAWYWAYEAHFRGTVYCYGRWPLASIRRAMRELGARDVRETWKESAQ